MPQSQEMSPAAESDIELETLLAFLDEMEQLQPSLSDGPTDQDWPSPESAPKARATRRTKVSSTQRRREEKRLLLSTIDKLQHELCRVRNSSLQQKVRDAVESSRLQNLRLRRLHECERNRAKTAATLLKDLDASVQVCGPCMS